MPTSDRTSVQVDAVEGDALHIRYTRITSNNVDMSMEAVIDAANAAWVAAELDEFAADDRRPQVHHESGNDRLHLYGSGPDHTPFVNVQNDRSAAPSWARKWAIVMHAHSAAELATLLRTTRPPHPLVTQLRTWADRLCQVSSTSRADLSAVIGPSVAAPPTGVERITLDDRPVGLGGIDVAIEDGSLRRGDLEAVFGPGSAVPRLDPTHHIHRQYEIDPAETPHRCTLFVRYGIAEPDDRVWSVKLRVDAATPQPTDG